MNPISQTDIANYDGFCRWNLYLYDQNIVDIDDDVFNVNDEDDVDNVDYVNDEESFICNKNFINQGTYKCQHLWFSKVNED